MCPLLSLEVAYARHMLPSMSSVGSGKLMSMTGPFHGPLPRATRSLASNSERVTFSSSMGWEGVSGGVYVDEWVFMMVVYVLGVFRG